ncbi:MAG TPA: hemerythrin domain-containing protein [Methanocella sp.]|nr:hemerythrin domain-containing protein [Methanocella sp.]
MQPVGLLMIEHRLIERMVRLMREEIDRIGQYGRVDPDFVDDAVGFMRTYADRCHHGKEEGVLFRDLALKPLSGEVRTTMDELAQEHAFARKTVLDIEAAKERYIIGEKNAPADLIASLNIITEFYPRHIAREDKHFFVPAMGYFTQEERDAMLKEFEDYDARVVHETYGAMIKRLEKRFAPPAPASPGTYTEVP